MLRTILFTIILAIVFFVAERYWVTPWLHSKWAIMLGFFLSVSFLLHQLVRIGLQNNRERFVVMYLAVTAARLVLSFLFVGFFLYQQVEQRRAFIFDFFVLYIFYTGFEIYGLSRKLRHNS